MMVKPRSDNQQHNILCQKVGASESTSNSRANGDNHRLCGYGSDTYDNSRSAMIWIGSW